MKRFQFKLEPLLTYRKYLERLAQQETARAQLDVKECEKVILKLEQEVIDQNEIADAGLKDGMNAADFKRFYNYFQAAELQIDDEKKRKQTLKTVLSQKLEALRKKSVDKKAMELYREKQKEIYDQDLLKTEQKELDEISSLKTARSSSNETN